MDMDAKKKEAPEERRIRELSHLDFGKTLGELGCFLNYEPQKLFPPTDRQLAALEEAGIFIPEGITNKDASAMLGRIGVWEIALGPDQSIVDLATELGTQYSAFTSGEDLIASIIAQASDRERAALYCYGVSCSMRGSRFSNMFADPQVSLFIGFSDMVAADPSLQKSLADRSPEDYAEPRKGTKIYKAAAAYLAGGGSV